jgi:hypothetical protein
MSQPEQYEVLVLRSSEGGKMPSKNKIWSAKASRPAAPLGVFLASAPHI